MAGRKGAARKGSGKKSRITRAGATELKEDQLSEVQGGLLPAVKGTTGLKIDLAANKLQDFQLKIQDLGSKSLKIG